MNNLDAIQTLLAKMTGPEKAEIDEMLKTELPVWVPLVGPQSDALESPADIGRTIYEVVR